MAEAPLPQEAAKNPAAATKSKEPSPSGGPAPKNKSRRQEEAVPQKGKEVQMPPPPPPKRAEPTAAKPQPAPEAPNRAAQAPQPAAEVVTGAVKAPQGAATAGQSGGPQATSYQALMDKHIAFLKAQFPDMRPSELLDQARKNISQEMQARSGESKALTRSSSL